MWASSGQYCGMKATFSFSLWMYFLMISARWIEALSSITSQCIGLIFSSSLMNLITSLKKSIKNTELILPTRFAAITLPVVVIAVTKDQEFLNQTLLMICSFPLGIHDRLFFCQSWEGGLVYVDQHLKVFDYFSQSYRKPLLD